MNPRPHHYMNADGTCHAGDLFEQGAEYVVLYTAEELVRIVNTEKAEAWDEGLRFGQQHWATNYAGVYQNGSPLRQAPNPYLAATPERRPSC